MKIKANGYKIKKCKLINTILITILSIATILGLSNPYSLGGGILFGILLIGFIKGRKLITSRYICFSKEKFECHYIYLGSYRGRKGGVYVTLKDKSFHLKYDEIKEYGNIKDLSLKFNNNNAYNIGFITKNNIKYFICTNEYTKEQLEIIIRELNKRIKIKPINEIIINENTINKFKLI